MTDQYSDMGEFHDFFMVDRWRELGDTLRATFGHLTAAHRVLDLGAGTGLGTRALAAGTAARITAIEPSLVQRAQLTTRVLDDDDLVRRVTVLAQPLPQALHNLPAPLDGFVAAHMLGHLDAAERRQTFATLRQLLAPTGIGLITVQSDDIDEHDVTDTHSEEVTIGDLTYTATYSMLDDNVHLNEYTVRRGGRTLRTVSRRGEWVPLTTDTLRHELASVGLALDVRERGIGLVTVS